MPSANPNDAFTVHQVADSGFYGWELRGPFVVDHIDHEEDRVWHIPSPALMFGPSDKPFESPVIEILNNERSHGRHVAQGEAFHLAPHLKRAYFLDTYGNMHVVRPFCDQDGAWGSFLQMPVPVEVLYNRFANEYNEIGGFNSCNEELNLLCDEEGQVRFLAYFAIDKIWLRSEETWQPLVDPTGLLLDGLEIIEVNTGVVEVFDQQGPLAASRYNEYFVA
ncbi:MAG: hypothetical protein RLZZ164_473 [Actinomycetota bacterium]|jgi:hypothetical protein